MPTVTITRRVAGQVVGVIATDVSNAEAYRLERNASEAFMAEFTLTQSQRTKSECGQVITDRLTATGKRISVTIETDYRRRERQAA